MGIAIPINMPAGYEFVNQNYQFVKCIHLSQQLLFTIQILNDFIYLIFYFEFVVQSVSNEIIVPTNRAHDLYQVKMAIQAHNKRSQEGHTSIKSAHVQQQAAELKTTSGPGE